ncbi:hypothetical protein [Microcoleus sp. F4-D5]|uniref:hypothetical protein n=1 Tax=Microcoleus sp. F4-D5 TaxID=2818760 RepID=UPI002FD069CC
MTRGGLGWDISGNESQNFVRSQLCRRESPINLLRILKTILPLLKYLADRGLHGVVQQSQYTHRFIHKKLDVCQIP